MQASAHSGQLLVAAAQVNNEGQNYSVNVTKHGEMQLKGSAGLFGLGKSRQELEAAGHISHPEQREMNECMQLTFQLSPLLHSPGQSHPQCLPNSIKESMTMAHRHAHRPTRSTQWPTDQPDPHSGPQTCPQNNLIYSLSLRLSS